VTCRCRIGLCGAEHRTTKKRLFITHSKGPANFHGKFVSPYTIRAFEQCARVAHRRGSGECAAAKWFSSPRLYASATRWKGCSAVIIKERRQGARLRFGRPFCQPDLSSLILQAQAFESKIIGSPAGRPTMSTRSRPPVNFGACFEGRPEDGGLWR